MKKLLILLSFFSLLSCKINEVSYNYPDNPDYARKARAGKVNGDLTLYEHKKTSSQE